MLHFIAAILCAVLGLAVVDFNIGGWRDLIVFSSVCGGLLYPVFLMLEDIL